AEGKSYVQLAQADSFVALGEGSLDLPAIVDALRANGYAGWLVVEQDRVVHEDTDTLADAVRNREYLRNACGLWARRRDGGRTAGWDAGGNAGRTADRTAGWMRGGRRASGSVYHRPGAGRFVRQRAAPAAGRGGDLFEVSGRVGGQHGRRLGPPGA